HDVPGIRACRQTKALQESRAGHDPPLLPLLRLINERSGIVRSDRKLPTIGKINMRMLLHDRYRAGEAPRRQKIIRTEQLKIIRRGPVYALIEGGMKPEVSAVRHDLNAAILCSELARHLQTIVGRRVIDDEDAKVLDLLAEDAGDT